MDIDHAARRLEALGNPTRLAIVRLLVRAGRDGLAVGAIQDHQGIAASTLSHHLHRLIRAGLVTQERTGTTLVCRAGFDELQGLADFLMAECCRGIAARPTADTPSTTSAANPAAG